MRKITLISLLALTIFSVVTFILTEKGYIVSWGLIGIYVFLATISFVVILVLLFLALLNKTTNLELEVGVVMKKTLFVFLGALAMILIQALISDQFQISPSTSNLHDIERVEINGTSQYIVTRGNDESNPVLLFLAGGPGGSQVQTAREFFPELEDEFTIVTWEQPGSGMSYSAYPIKSLTPQQYVDDGHELTLYLKEKFNKDKIYILGQSWGSYLAIELAKQHPEEYHAIFSAGQMVDFLETEKFCYHKALEIAKSKNDEQQIRALENLGEPPYYGSNISIEMGTYLIYLHQYMMTNPNINHVNFDTFKSMFSPEYSVIDAVNFLKALYFTFAQVYQQLYQTDLRETHTEIDVPVYIFHGKHDYNAPLYLAEEYYNLLDAPKKELIIFERSGHEPFKEEAERFQSEVIRIYKELNLDN